MKKLYERLIKFIRVQEQTGEGVSYTAAEAVLQAEATMACNVQLQRIADSLERVVDRIEEELKDHG